MPIDPVCKMNVKIVDAAASHDYHSETVYFCSIQSQKTFEKDPKGSMRDMTDEEKMAG